MNNQDNDDRDVNNLLHELSNYSDDENEFQLVEDNKEEVERILQEEYPIMEEEEKITEVKKESIDQSSPPKAKPEDNSKKNLAEHPLETLEKAERDISMKLGGQQDLDSKFLLSNLRITGEQKHSSIVYNTLEVITKHTFPDDNNSVPLHNNEFWGTPKCIAVYLSLSL